MQTKKLLSVFIIYSLALPAPLLSQAAGTNILEVVQAHKPGEFFYFAGFGFALTNAGITSLTGIERIKGIDRVTAMNLSGNNVGVIKSNTFNYPVLKNIKILNLSANNLTMIDSDGLHGLENLEVLLLENNNLTSLANGALNGLEKIKYIYIANNPEMGTLKNQIQKQLPKATVYTISANRKRFIKAIAAVTAMALSFVAVTLYYKIKGDKFSAEEERIRKGLTDLELVSKGLAITRTQLNFIRAAHGINKSDNLVSAIKERNYALAHALIYRLAVNPKKADSEGIIPLDFAHEIKDRTMINILNQKVSENAYPVIEEM